MPHKKILSFHFAALAFVFSNDEDRGSLQVLISWPFDHLQTNTESSFFFKTVALLSWGVLEGNKYIFFPRFYTNSFISLGSRGFRRSRHLSVCWSSVRCRRVVFADKTKTVVENFRSYDEGSIWTWRTTRYTIKTLFYFSIGQWQIPT